MGQMHKVVDGDVMRSLTWPSDECEALRAWVKREHARAHDSYLAFAASGQEGQAKLSLARFWAMADVGRMLGLNLNERA